MGQQKEKMIEEHNKDMAELQEEKYLVCSGMSVYGGSFIKSLGVTLGQADENNTVKIRNAFPEYWKEYLRVGKKFIESEQAGRD